MRARFSRREHLSHIAYNIDSDKFRQANELFHLTNSMEELSHFIPFCPDIMNPLIASLNDTESPSFEAFIIQYQCAWSDILEACGDWDLNAIRVQGKFRCAVCFKLLDRKFYDLFHQFYTNQGQFIEDDICCYLSRVNNYQFLQTFLARYVAPYPHIRRLLYKCYQVAAKLGHLECFSAIYEVGTITYGTIMVGQDGLEVEDFISYMHVNCFQYIFAKSLATILDIINNNSFDQGANARVIATFDLFISECFQGCLEHRRLDILNCIFTHPDYHLSTQIIGIEPGNNNHIWIMYGHSLLVFMNDYVSKIEQFSELFDWCPHFRRHLIHMYTQFFDEFLEFPAFFELFARYVNEQNEIYKEVVKHLPICEDIKKYYVSLYF